MYTMADVSADRVDHVESSFLICSVLTRLLQCRFMSLKYVSYWKPRQLKYE